MKKNRFLIFGTMAMAAAATMLGGCSQDDLADIGVTPVDAVSFTAGISATDSQASRTTGGGDLWTATDNVGIFMLTTNGDITDTDDVLAANVKYLATPDGNDASDATFASATGVTPIYYPHADAVDFVAYYPWSAAASGSGGLSVDVTGQADTVAQNALDMLYAKATGKSRSKTPVALDFDHVLAKVTLDVKLGAGLSGGSLDGTDVTTAVFAEMPASATLSLHDGTLTAGSTGDFAALKATSPSGGSGVVATFTALVVPQTGGTDRTATFTVDDNEYVWRIPNVTAFAKGTHYTYTVTVNDWGVTVGEPTIGRWATVNHNGEGSNDGNGSGTATVKPNATLTYTDGTTGRIAGKRNTTTGFYEIPLGSGGKTVYNVTLEDCTDATVLIGRTGGTVALNIDTNGTLSLRGAVDGKTPIGTYAEFAMINTAAGGPAGNYIQEADLDMLGFVDAGSLENSTLKVNDLARQNWVPIGSNTYGYMPPFTGTFDGGGYTITNLYIYAYRASPGLFGYVESGGKLTGIGIVSGWIKGSIGTGSVCGMNAGTITNCYNKIPVSGSSNMGGLCGVNLGTITDCYNSGPVTSLESYVGGICGYNNGGTISNCYNTAAVTGTRSIGGVCGKNRGTITECYNTETISASMEWAGGVCGDNSGDITDSYNEGTVTGADYVGGVCGSNSGDISVCYNAGYVTGRIFVGGVCGDNTDTITNCYNEGAINGTMAQTGGVCGSNSSDITGSYNEGTVNGWSNTGGVCGYNDGDITACYNTGTVSATRSNTGGVCGGNLNTINYCYNTGAVTGSVGVGGVCGYNYEGGGNVTECYYLRYTFSQPGIDDGKNSGTTAFSGVAWPTWATTVNDGTDGNHWSDIGEWVSEGSHEGANSTFPRLWWEED